jgi:ABC-2 type transport system permease protein
MNPIKVTFATECIKLRRSKIVWILVVIFVFIPFMMSLLFFLARNPQMAAKFGMIGTKSTMLRFGNPDWPNFLLLLNQSVAAIGLMGFGFVTSWIFGREYSDHTVKDILALPVSRTSIVISKFLIIIVGCLLLALLFFISGLIAGTVIGLPDLTMNIVMMNFEKFIKVTLLSLLLCTPVSFFASYGRGYMLPMGFVILTLIIANFTGMVGLGPYFPWAIPGIFSMTGATGGMQMIFASYIILLFTSFAGFAGTIAWWRYADQK